MDTIESLCKGNTNLSYEDIEIIKSIASTLKLIADSSNGNVFIDVMTKHKDEAIVVAADYPNKGNNLYERNVVGELAIRKNEPAVIRTLEVGMPSRDLRAITQEQRKVKQSVEPIKNRHNKTIAVLIIEKDVTENLEERTKLQLLADANEQLTNEISMADNKNISYYVNDAVLILNSKGIVVFNNPMADRLYKKLGYKDELIGMKFSNLSLVNLDFDDIINENKIVVREEEVGELTLQIKFITQPTENNKLVMLVRDLTEVKEKEKELILKSVAIKEIHHRVKNNLQTVASLLRLQARRSKSEEFNDIVNESMNRILSISATHEILAKQGIDEVNIKEVLNKIKYSMVILKKVQSLKLSILIKGDDLKVSSDKSTTIALVVNEIIQNSLKHAFNNKTEGEIVITIKEGNIYSSICVIDNGGGFDIEGIDSQSLGLNIVKSLVKDKLGGNLNIESNKEGTKVYFDFRNE